MPNDLSTVKIVCAVPPCNDRRLIERSDSAPERQRSTVGGDYRLVDALELLGALDGMCRQL
jgi:hypothetical protein